MTTEDRGGDRTPPINTESRASIYQYWCKRYQTGIDSEDPNNPEWLELDGMLTKADKIHGIPIPRRTQVQIGDLSDIEESLDLRLGPRRNEIEQAWRSKRGHLVEKAARAKITPIEPYLRAGSE